MHGNDGVKSGLSGTGTQDGGGHDYAVANTLPYSSSYRAITAVDSQEMRGRVLRSRGG